MVIHDTFIAVGGRPLHSLLAKSGTITDTVGAEEILWRFLKEAREWKINFYNEARTHNTDHLGEINAQSLFVVFKRGKFVATKEVVDKIRGFYGTLINPIPSLISVRWPIRHQ